MEISSEKIKTILRDYDNQNSKLWAVFFKEDNDVTALRNLCHLLPNENRCLTLQELISFITILLHSTATGNIRHDALFTQLKNLIGENKLKAFDRLNKKNLLSDHIDRVSTHTNPESAARMLTHFAKHQKELPDKTIDEFLSQPDPYHSLKSITSTAAVIKFIKNSTLDSEKNQRMIAKQPIPIAKAIKNLILNNVFISNQILDFVIQHSSPDQMAAAIVELYRCDEIKFKPMNKIFIEINNHQNPLDFVNGVIILVKHELNTDLNRKIIAQSNQPSHSASLLCIEQAKNHINSLGKIPYGILRGQFFFQTGILSDPVTMLESAENQIKQEMKQSR